MDSTNPFTLKARLTCRFGRMEAEYRCPPTGVYISTGESRTGVAAVSSAAFCRLHESKNGSKKMNATCFIDPPPEHARIPLWRSNNQPGHAHNRSLSGRESPATERRPSAKQPAPHTDFC